MTNGFDLGHDLDIWILKVICDLDHLVTKVRCKDLPDSDWGDFRCRRAIDSSSFDYSAASLDNDLGINYIDGFVQDCSNPTGVTAVLH